MLSEKPAQYKEIIKGFLSKLTHFSELDFQILWDNLYYKELNKYEVLTNIGEIENRLCFIMSGFTRIYCMNGHKEYTLRFNFPGSFFCSYASFIDRIPSALAIEALTPGSMFFFSYESMEELYRKAPGAERIGKSMIERLYIMREEKEISFATQSAEQNYLDLLKSQPELIMQIPQKYIASYLGITPESLSRIRSRLWKN